MMKFDIDPPDPESPEIYLCCCCPEMTHDETMKLKLMFKDEKDDIAILTNLPPGKVKEVDKPYFGENKFQDCQTIGKNRIIYQIFNAFCSENIRMAYLVGESGSGKSMLSKHIANYMTERHKVTVVHYLNMDKVSNISVFLSSIPDYRLMTSFSSYENQKPKSLGQDSFIILDNMDLILANHFKAFRSSMQELVEHTKLKFLIISSSTTWSQNYQPMWQEKIFQVPTLNTQAAAKMLKGMANDYLPYNLRNIINLQGHPIFKPTEQFSLRPTPKVISDIAFLLKKGNKGLNQIYEDYCLKSSGENARIENQTLAERRTYLE